MNALFIHTPLAAMENPFLRFGVNWHDFIFQAIAFMIIAWILNRFVFKTVLKTVADRQAAAEAAEASRAKIQQELKSLEESRAEQLKQAQKQADQMLSEAKARIAEMVNQEKQRCEQMGTELLAQARENAQLDQMRMKAEFREEIATMIVALTERLTQMNLAQADRDQLLQSAIQQMTSENGK